MANIDTRAVLIPLLRAALNNTVIIRSNQTGDAPPYPYGSYTLTSTSYDGGTWGIYEDGKDRKPVQEIWSITFQSDNYDQAVNLTRQAHEWLDHVGRTQLNDNGIIINQLGDITPRDNLLTIEYEYRSGFDFTVWTLREVDSPTTAGVIETVELHEMED